MLTWQLTEIKCVISKFLQLKMKHKYIKTEIFKNKQKSD